jgi:hypothetical protein
MIAFASGLKNWSRGYVKESLLLFEKVEKYQAEEPSEEYRFYRSRIADYKQDASLVAGLRAGYYPKSMAELNQRIAKLQGLESKLKTKGRVLFDLGEWHVQCDIHKKRLIREAKEAFANNNTPIHNPDIPTAAAATWKDLIKEIKPDLSKCEFQKVEQLLGLKNFELDVDKQRVEQLIYLCQNASGYKATVRRSMGNRRTNATIILKADGKEFIGVYDVGINGFEVKRGARESRL